MNTLPRTWYKASLCVLILFAPLTILGQTTMGTLTVRVIDPTSAAVASATVKVTNLETGLMREQITNDEGLAKFDQLPPGKYKVEVSVGGFKTLIAPDVVVGISRSDELTLRMEAGAVSEAINIGAEEIVIDDVLRDLPNLNNDLTPLLQAVPGAAAGNPSALGKIVVDGKGKEQQTLRLDGLDVTPITELPSGDPALPALDSLLKTNVALNISKTDTFAGAVRFFPPGGAASTYDLSPMYGPGTGSLVEGISYRGLDGKRPSSWKFQFSEAVRNDALNARNYFDYEGKNAIRRHQFGVRLGRPFFDNKLSFFFGYDGIRGRVERVVYEAVPVDALCLCRGGSITPLLRGFLPAGTTEVSGASGNSDFIVARRRVRSSSGANAWDTRLDLSGLTGRHLNSLNLRLTRQAADFFVPDGVTGRRQRQRVVPANGLAKLTFVSGTYAHYLKFGFNETGSHLNLELPPSTDPSVAQSLITIGGTVPVSNLPGNPSAVPTAALGGLIKGAGRGFNQTPVSLIAAYDLSGSLNETHVLETGFESRSIRLKFDRFGGLTYSFPNVAALLAGSPNRVDFLSDLSGPTPFSDLAGPRRAAQEYYLTYFLIQWAASPRLLVNYGFRYDYFGPTRERDDRAVVIDPLTGQILPRGMPFYRAKKNNVQPRANLAFQIRPDLILRTGAGFYSGAPRIGEMLLPIESDRFNMFRLGGTFPIPPAELIRDFVESPDARQFQPLSFARDFTTPERVFRWDAMITRTFWSSYDLNVVYTGNVGRNLPVAGIANQITSVVTNPDPTLNATVRRQFDFERGGLLFKPFGELQFRSSAGRSSYNGVTIQFKRNNGSLTGGDTWLDWRNFKSFNAQYTLARNVGNVSGTVASQNSDFDADYGFNASDVRHNFSISAGYRLWDDAKGRPQKGWWGWTISPTVTARGGLPLIVRLDRPDVVYIDGSGNVFGVPAAGRRAEINTPGGGATGAARVPDLIQGVNPFLRQGLMLLNPAAFAIPEPGQFGNLKRGQLRGPRSFQVDLAVTRVLFNETKLVDENGVSGELKIEFTNLFNRANFNNPAVSLPNALGTSLLGDRLQPGMPFTRLAAGSTFGVISAADAGRQIQFSLTLKFNDGF